MISPDDVARLCDSLEEEEEEEDANNEKNGDLLIEQIGKCRHGSKRFSKQVLLACLTTAELTGKVAAGATDVASLLQDVEEECFAPRAVQISLSAQARANTVATATHMVGSSAFAIGGLAKCHKISALAERAIISPEHKAPPVELGDHQRCRRRTSNSQTASKVEGRALGTSL